MTVKQKNLVLAKSQGRAHKTGSGEIKRGASEGARLMEAHAGARLEECHGFTCDWLGNGGVSFHGG